VPFPYFPPAFTHWNGEKLEIRANRLPGNIQLEKPAKPGEVIAKGDAYIRVACGTGSDYLDITALSCPIFDIQVGDVFEAQHLT